MMPPCQNDPLGQDEGTISRAGRCVECDVYGCKQRLAGPPAPVAPPPSALDVQVAGSHYKDMVIQPFQYIHANGISFAEGNVIKYVSRWRSKGGIDDLKKARHFLDMLIEAEASKP